MYVYKRLSPSNSYFPPSISLSLLTSPYLSINHHFAMLPITCHTVDIIAVQSRNYAPSAVLAQVPAYISPPPPSDYQMWILESMKTVATTSTLAICVILWLTLLLFSSFAHQTARGSAEIACPCGIRRVIMVITCKYHYPANKPPFLFCPMLVCTKGGSLVVGFYSKSTSVVFSPG